MSEEIWKPVRSFPNYSVSSFGRVKRVIAGRGSTAGKILKQLIILAIIGLFCGGDAPDILERKNHPDRYFVAIKMNPFSNSASYSEPRSVLSFKLLPRIRDRLLSQADLARNENPLSNTNACHPQGKESQPECVVRNGVVERPIPKGFIFGTLCFGVAVFLMVIEALLMQLGWHRRPE